MTAENLKKANELNEYITLLTAHLQAWQNATGVKELRFLEGAKNHIAAIKFIDFEKLKDNVVANILIDLETSIKEFKSI